MQSTGIWYRSPKGKVSAMTMATKSCVLLADRHRSVADGVSMLLEPVFDTVFMVADEVSLLLGVGRLQPEMVVMDLSLVPGEGLELLQRIRADAPDAKLMVLSIYDEPSIVRSVMNAGADAYVLKRSLATDLVAAVNTLVSGKHYVSPALAAGLVPETEIAGG